MPKDYMLSAKAGLGPQALDRRSVLLGGMTLISSWSLALAQNNPPKLLILPKGVTSHVRFTERSPTDPRKVITRTNISLEGCLVCNGAAVSRTDYKELFGVIGTRYGRGDETSTFGLPNYPVQYDAGRLVSGMAICPSSKLGLPLGVVLPFDTDAASSAAPSQKLP